MGFPEPRVCPGKGLLQCHEAVQVCRGACVCWGVCQCARARLVVMGAVRQHLLDTVCVAQHVCACTGVCVSVHTHVHQC